MGRRLAPGIADCPVTEDVSGRLLRLPFFVGLSAADQDRVLETILGWDETASVPSAPDP